MLKPILIFFFGLFVFQTARAQNVNDTGERKADTTAYFMDDNNMLSTTANAKYVLFIMPPDSDSNGHYKIQEFYTNGKPKMFSTSINRSKIPTLVGTCMRFYPNGHKESIVNYDNGVIDGDIIRYYPNGKLYSIEKHNKSDKIKLIETRDSTGNILCENGNGKWVKLDDNFQNKIEEGQVKDSLKEGEWNGFIKDTGRYVCTYNKDKLISGIGYDKNGNAYPFKVYETKPHFKGDLPALYKFLNKEINYPHIDKINNVQGLVLVTFFVEADGMITDVKAIRGPDLSLQNEAIRAVKTSPAWVPGTKAGIPVRELFLVPIHFSLTASNR